MAGLSTSIGSLPSFASPPVVEVAVGVEFLQLPGLGAVQLVALHEMWRDEFPQVREQPALPPTTSPDGPPGFQFQVMSGPPALRLWMLNDDEDELLQVQNDRLFLNWRRAVDDDRKYPRYDHLRDLYQRVFADFHRRVAEANVGTFRPHTAVVTYVNRFALAPGEELKDAIAPLSPSWNLLAGATPELRVTAPVGARDGSGSLAGRLMATALIDANDRNYGYLEVVTRITVSEPSVDVFDCLDLAHESCVNGFERLTTEKMHERWGKE
jgi:uncharacterized protein (TIGR04255 family)